MEFSDLIGRFKEHWSQSDARLEFIQESESYVYRIVDEDKDLILRVTSSSHRNINFLRAELDYLMYLHKHDLRVSIPVFSKQGDLIETITFNDEVFYASAFLPAKGEPVKYKSENWNEEMFNNWGKYLAHMHDLAERYIPAANCKRWDWKDDKIIKNGRSFLKERNELQALKEFDSLEGIFSKYSIDSVNYGLIHGDLCIPNFHYLKKEITSFDFDDSCYHWFIYDIAVCIWPTRFLPEVERKNYLDWLLDGYLSQRKIGTIWIERIPDLIRLRNIYMFIYRLMNIDKFKNDDKDNWFEVMRRSFEKPVEWDLRNFL